MSAPAMAPAAVRANQLLFSGEMIRAILAGRKSQTRRVVQLRDLAHSEVDLTRLQPGYPDGPRPVWDDGDDPNAFSTRNPFGAPGDRLWVRETWTAEVEYPVAPGDWRTHWWHEVPAGFRGPKNTRRIYYAADGAEHEVYCYESSEPLDLPSTGKHLSREDAAAIRWQPSIHMPRWASRILLEITDVRVERLQAVTEEDARAEGVVPEPYQWRPLGSKEPMRHNDHRHEFRCLWDSLNARRGFGWNVNPWVWVLEFRRIQDAHRGASA